MSNQLVNTIVVVVSLAALTWFLYRPRIQDSERYQATVVPLANVMDVGFIVLSPIMVALVGYDAPLFMLGLCAVAIVTGFAISYNINNYEPLIGTSDRVTVIDTASNWALFLASIANVGYYALLLSTLVLLPLDRYTDQSAAVWAAIVLAAIGVAGLAGKLDALDTIGARTTAFNLAAIFAVLFAFVVYNVQEALGGRWEFPTYNPPNTPDDLRKLLGFFAMVQGFEASRYLGARFSAGLRISTMRLAQYISTIVFVVLIASTLILFTQVNVEPEATAIFEISEEVSAFLPYLILLAALGSQLSAITNAVTSRSELLLETTRGRMHRRWTFPLLLVPAIALVLLTDVTQAVAIASRVFAAYFLLQAVIAGVLAYRAKAWWRIGLFAIIGMLMAIIMIFSIPT